MIYSVDTDESYNDLIDCLKEGQSFNDSVLNGNIQLELSKEYKDKLYIDDIINGKNKEVNIVNISVDNDTVYLFKEHQGNITYSTVPYKHWIIARSQLNDSFTRLKGNQIFKWFKEYNSAQEYQDVRSSIYKYKCYTVYNQTENFMIRNGHTYFKGMKSDQVSLLSFDIETTGLNPNADDAKVLLITNTYRNINGFTTKTFVESDYESDAHMIQDWCDWVRELDPSILLGHNIIIFDIPYINTRYYNTTGYNIPLGRLDKNEIIIEDRTRELRKDGGQSYTYSRISCFGREIVDTFFLSIKADIGRKYESYGLKAIIAHEKLEDEGRQHYDASTIKDNWDNPEERRKIIAYAEADSRDPIKLYDLMIAPFFYLTTHVPKSFQIMIESASGSQLNAMMVRSYLQINSSIAEASSDSEFEGAVSFGNTGIYNDVVKWDVASLYPSIMRNYKIYPKEKDPNEHFLKMLEYFTLYRLENKKKAKETGDRFFKDLEQMTKIFINSAYGFMGASGLNYNYPSGAAEVTRYGRDIITKSIEWATGHTIKKEIDKIINEGKENEKIKYKWVLGDKVREGKNLTLVNGDTDSISVTYNRYIDKQEREQLLKELNSEFPNLISWEDDGYYSRFIVLKAKNYILKEENKPIKLKGSSLKDAKREPALREMINETINELVENTPDKAIETYRKYIKETHNITDIKRWASKKTITKSILNCATTDDVRPNERNIYEAVKHIDGLQEGDKAYIYPAIISQEIEQTVLKNGKIRDKIKKVTGLKIIDNWTGDEDKEKLVERVVATMDIFSNVLDSNMFIDYSIKKNKDLLDNLLNM